MEEDIKILERFLKICDEDLFTEISIKTNGLTRNAIEHLIKSYKKLEEENKTLKNIVSEIFNSEDVTENFIPFSLVEETKKELHENYINSDGSEFLKLEHQLEILEKLLEKRK